MAGNHGGASSFARTLIGLGIVFGVIGVALLVGPSGASPSPASSSRRAEVQVPEGSTTTTTTVAPAASSEPAPTAVLTEEASTPAANPAPSPQPAAAAAPAPPAPEQFMLIVCDSGTVSDGGVDTSSRVVTRVPLGTPVPAGCYVG